MDFRAELQNAISSGRRIVVVGLGISGIESAAFCRRLGIPVVCIESLTERDYLSRGKYADRLEELRAAGVELQFGVSGEDAAPLLEGVCLGVVSPGVSYESAVYGALKRRNIKLISEFELGIELYRNFKKARVAAVTGSNGKSTTVSLIHHLLQSAGKSSVLCGNVGVPVVSGLSGGILNAGACEEEQTLVVEASSYQLESCSVLKPSIGVLLNLSDNHLERHGTMERYAAAKAKMFACQEAADFALLNADDARVCALAAKLKASVYYFGALTAQSEGHKGAFFDYRLKREIDRVFVQLGGEPEEYHLHGISLMGAHNRCNIAAALLAVRLLGLPQAGLEKALVAFQPLEHRMEFVKSQRPGLVINDSKATTVAAAAAALECVLETFPDRSLTLLIGGLAKAGSWTPLMEKLSRALKTVKQVICFGKDGRILASHCQAASIPCQVRAALKDAASLALAEAQSSDVVLLSPGCASFDEFTDFEARGQAFKNYVLGS